jgi:MFS family permease
VFAKDFSTRPPALRYRDFRLFAIITCRRDQQVYSFVVQNYRLNTSQLALGLLNSASSYRAVFGPIRRCCRSHGPYPALKLSRLANLIQTLIFAALIFTGMLQFWHIVVLVVFMAIVSSFSTAAQQVVIVNLVPQEGVVSALALNSATHNLTKVIGPSIGGVLLTLIGPGPCVLIQLSCYRHVVHFVAYAADERASPMASDWLKDIVEGLLPARESPLFATILTTYSNGLFGISYAQFLPYFAQEVLHVGPAGYGVLVSAPGVGAVLISFFLSTHSRLRGMRRLLVGSSLIYAVSIFLFALSPIYFLSIALLAIVGSMQMSAACWRARLFRKNVRS